MILWSTFLGAVNACLGPEGTRRGLEGFRAQHITNAIIDLCRFVPSFRLGNSTVFTAANLTQQSQAMVGVLPPGCKPKAFYIFSSASGDDPNCKRYKLDHYPWSKRNDILCGRLSFDTWWGNCCWGPSGTCPPSPSPPPVDPTNPNPWSWCSSRGYVYSISPHLDSFIIFPSLNQYDSLLLVWDGYKTVFNPNDLVPYPIEASEAVSAYVFAKVHKLIDREPQLAAADNIDYLNARRALIREYRDNLVTDGQDDEYLSTLVPPPAQPFITAGAEAIVLLQFITAIAGTTANCLQAIPTIGLTGPLTVAVIINGITQLWTLQTGSAPTDVPNGICLPPDNALSGLEWLESNP